MSADGAVVVGWSNPPPTSDSFRWTAGSGMVGLGGVCFRSPGAVGPDGRWYSRDSILVVDEVCTAEPGSLTRGMGYTVPRVAEEILAACERWGIRAEGVADDSIFARGGHSGGSIAEEFERCGVDFQPAQKGERRNGWEVMKRLLQDAGKPDRPGMFISRACTYAWQTLPYLGRDPRRVDDVDSRGPDHAGDGIRYAVTRDLDRSGVVSMTLHEALWG